MQNVFIGANILDLTRCLGIVAQHITINCLFGLPRTFDFSVGRWPVAVTVNAIETETLTIILIVHSNSN
jgi:hypothetical protein